MSDDKEKDLTRKPWQRKLKKFSTKGQQIFKSFVFFPPFMIALGFIVGARLFELGFIGMEGRTVWVTGTCEIIEDSGKGTGVYHSDLALDQVIVSVAKEDGIKGIIRKTRESISCKKENVTVDRFPPLEDFGKELIALPEIKKLEKKKVVKTTHDYSQYENKRLLVSGICRQTTDNKVLDPFRDKIIDVTNVTQSKKDLEVYFFSGIREDNIPVVCNKEDITYELYQEKTALNTEEYVKVPTSYRGKLVKVSGLCFPDMSFYNKIKKKPLKDFYDLHSVPVEVTFDKYNQETSELDILVGKIATKKKMDDGNIHFGQRIICEKKVDPIKVNLVEDNEKVELKE